MKAKVEAAMTRFNCFGIYERSKGLRLEGINLEIPFLETEKKKGQP